MGDIYLSFLWQERRRKIKKKNKKGRKKAREKVKRNRIYALTTHLSKAKPEKKRKRREKWKNQSMIRKNKCIVFF